MVIDMKRKKEYVVDIMNRDTQKKKNFVFGVLVDADTPTEAERLAREFIQRLTDNKTTVIAHVREKSRRKVEEVV